MTISFVGAGLSPSPQGLVSKNLALLGKYEAGHRGALIQPSLSLEQFSAAIEQEFIHGSAIDPTLFATSIRVVPDVIYDNGEVLETPIHEGLNWKYTRFWIKQPLATAAALLLNEDRSCWQAKLSQPRMDSKGKACKYETPVGNGSKAFLPDLPTTIRQSIADRYGVTAPTTGSFWRWLETHPEIPIVWTEGGKKALCLLSHGYVAISLYGVYGGYSRNAIGERALISDVARFCQPGRSHLLAFDQDEKSQTRLRVNIALNRFGSLLVATGGSVSIASWEGSQGKGIDDLIVNAGIAAWQRSQETAMSLVHWRIWQRLQHRLTWTAAIRPHTADLSTLNLAEVPAQGIIALSSAKGTGKTKWMSQQLQNCPKTLAAGHRIALMRNLAERLSLGYLGDLDKVNGEFIDGSAYTLRVGFCVDSLLAIDPAKFAGCDLVIDEVCQVVRHLLTSSTCAKDGKRPALLARWRELIRNARRVLVADADLDNAVLHYLRELRQDSSPVFLIHNDYQPPGYPVRFLEAGQSSAIIEDLLAAMTRLPQGKVLYVATDSKLTSKTLARTIQQQFPDQRILLVNSESSGGEIERAFITQPDQHLSQFDVVICSPSVGTGVSIESQNIIHAVYGIFTGSSVDDADMAQALSRVREPVERIVWCAKRGTNLSQVSSSTNPLEVKAHLQSRTHAIVRLVRSNLREDVTGALGSYNWQADPHVNFYCHLMAAQNRSMLNLRDALLIRLRFEGNAVTVEPCQSCPTLQEQLRRVKAEVKQADAAAIAMAEDLSLSEILELETREGTSPEQRRAISKYYLKEFYCLENLTVEDVLADKEGRHRGEILNLESLLFPDRSIDYTARSLEKQAKWNQGLCPWDIAHTALRQAIREHIGLKDLVNHMVQGSTWCKYDLRACADRARALKEQIKVGLHFSITDQMSDTQIMHQLLAQLGIRVKQVQWSRAVPGHEGEKLRVYAIDLTHWQQIQAVLVRRAQRRAEQWQEGSGGTLPPALASGSPIRFNMEELMGDPEVTGCAALLKEAMLYGLEEIRAVLLSWAVELRGRVVSWMQQKGQESFRMLQEIVPDLVLNCCSG